eukprot:15358094-Ditylum_brightwellii.AAC.1
MVIGKDSSCLCVNCEGINALQQGAKKTATLVLPQVSTEPAIDSADTENAEGATGNSTEDDTMIMKENIVVSDVPCNNTKEGENIVVDDIPCNNTEEDKDTDKPWMTQSNVDRLNKI